MTDFRQRQAISTLTAPAARGLAPHFLVQPDTRHALCPATVTTIQLIDSETSSIKNMVFLPVKGQNTTITIFGKYSIDNSRSPDSHLLTKKDSAFSGIPPMTGFRQRTSFSMPTVLVKCGDLDKA